MIIDAYRGHGDDRWVQLSGRVLGSRPADAPMAGHSRWRNLLNSYRRFESDELPDVALKLSFRGVETEVRSDREGYYQVRLDAPAGSGDQLWETALATLPDGSAATPHAVLQVGRRARIGIISDIDDTLLHSQVLDWRAAARLVLLENARTRRPLPGVARLYRALQHGADGDAANPIFYVSSSPWNLYGLLDRFLALNTIPAGPLFLRDLGWTPRGVRGERGHRHKLARARELIGRYPNLRWLLIGDSGQADAELYAEAAEEFGTRIQAIYIRDVDGAAASDRDRFVDRHISRLAGREVPMLRVSDSGAIARHAHSLGLIDALDRDAVIAATALEAGAAARRN